MNMVEKVARAIYRCDGAVYGTDERMFDPYPFDELDEIQVAGFMDRARAAIEAMREPTDRMADDGYRAMHCGADAVWQAMIDAALKEEG